MFSLVLTEREPSIAAAGGGGRVLVALLSFLYILALSDTDEAVRINFCTVQPVPLDPL